MITKIESINAESLEEAKQIIENGGLVALPTETVYGLGADALNSAAVAKIFEIKGRPSDNPLIVHVHKSFDIERLVYDDKPYAKILRERFIPGPLTMIYKSKGVVCNLVSCGLDTLAIRVPSHEGAQQFLKYVDMPIAAPSANVSKHTSPVTAEHVKTDLDGKIELILDGGQCQGGIESTVLDVTGEVPVIYRSGLITKEMIIEAVGNCLDYVPNNERVRSPGMKYKHYSPNCETYLFDKFHIDFACSKYDELLAQGKTPYIMCEDSVSAYFHQYNVLNLGDTPEKMAANLYYLLHLGEKLADAIIAVKPFGTGGVMDGVLNRLIKACNNDY